MRAATGSHTHTHTTTNVYLLEYADKKPRSFYGASGEGIKLAGGVPWSELGYQVHHEFHS